MNRRDFLSTTGSAFLTGVSGCVSDGNGNEEGGIDVTASVNKLELPRAGFEVTATNRGNESFLTTPKKLSVAKLSDGEPKHIRRVFRLLEDGPAIELEPGGSKTWEITVDNENESFLGDTGGMEMNLTGLGPGTCLFGFSSDTETYGVDEDRAASVEFVGEQPEVTPVNGAEIDERDGRLHVVPSSEDNETDSEVEIVASKVEKEDEETHEETPELVTEQVLQFGVMRNAVYYFDTTDGANELYMEGERVEREAIGFFEQILVATDDNVSPFFAHRGGSYYFEYEGDVYEIRTEAEV